MAKNPRRGRAALPGDAKEAGATIEQEPADQFYGDRTYCAEDPEGHVWYFAQHVHDVAPEDMKPS